MYIHTKYTNTKQKISNLTCINGKKQKLNVLFQPPKISNKMWKISWPHQFKKFFLLFSENHPKKLRNFAWIWSEISKSHWLVEQIKITSLLNNSQISKNECQKDKKTVFFCFTITSSQRFRNGWHLSTAHEKWQRCKCKYLILFNFFRIWHG